MVILRPSFAALEVGAYGVHQSGRMLHPHQCLSKSIKLPVESGGNCLNRN